MRKCKVAFEILVIIIILTTSSGLHAQTIEIPPPNSTQVWKVKNLNTDNYRNGDPIPQVKNTGEWLGLKTGAWCWFNNDSARYSVYGKLYNWYAIMDPRGLAPSGWHIPTQKDWLKLDSNCYSGADMNIVDYSKPPCLFDPNRFAATKVGYRTEGGNFSTFGQDVVWWSSSLNNNYSTPGPWCFMVSTRNNVVIQKNCGFFVRLIKD